jgi:hypothetical protein
MLAQPCGQISDVERQPDSHPSALSNFVNGSQLDNLS